MKISLGGLVLAGALALAGASAAQAGPLAPAMAGGFADDAGLVSKAARVCDRWGNCYWRPGPPRHWRPGPPPGPRVVCTYRWRDTYYGPRRVRVCTRRW